MKTFLITFALCAGLQAETNPLIHVTTTNQNASFLNRLRMLMPFVPENAPRTLSVFIHDEGSNAQEYRVVVVADKQVVADTVVQRTGARTFTYFYLDVDKATVTVEPHAKSAASTEVDTQ